MHYCSPVVVISEACCSVSEPKQAYPALHISQSGERCSLYWVLVLVQLNHQNCYMGSPTITEIPAELQDAEKHENFFPPLLSMPLPGLLQGLAEQDLV